MNEGVGKGVKEAVGSWRWGEEGVEGGKVRKGFGGSRK